MGKGNIYLWTGNGAGKTTSALGVALRAIAHNKKVVIVQFMKGRKYIGEYKIKNKLGRNYKIYQFGSPEFVNLKHPSEKDINLANKGFEFAKKILKKEKPFLLILDEINITLATKLLNLKDVIKFIKQVPKSTNVYLTGRYAPNELKKYCDFVNEITTKKQPKFWKAKKGIEY